MKFKQMPSCFRNYNGCPYVLEFRFCALELLKFSLSAPLLLFLLPFSNFYLFIFSLFPVCSRLLFVFCLLMLASTSSSCSSSFFSISLSFFSFFFFLLLLDFSLLLLLSFFLATFSLLLSNGVSCLNQSLFGHRYLLRRR